MTHKLVAGIDVNVKDNEFNVSLVMKTQALDHFHGLFRTFINNMVKGPTEGFEKDLK